MVLLLEEARPPMEFNLYLLLQREHTASRDRRQGEQCPKWHTTVLNSRLLLNSTSEILANKIHSCRLFDALFSPKNLTLMQQTGLQCQK